MLHVGTRALGWSIRERNGNTPCAPQPFRTGPDGPRHLIAPVLTPLVTALSAIFASILTPISPCCAPCLTPISPSGAPRPTPISPSCAPRLTPPPAF